MNTSLKDNELFLLACNKVINSNCLQSGIGTLSEKTLHAVLKNFYEPDINHQEIKIENFIADIFRDNEIIEIQTRSFNNMRRKLDLFLKLYPVTIVYPIPYTKYLVWIDSVTGEVVSRRKSPKKGNPFDAFRELYKIKMFLDNPNLSICLTFIDIEEYRLLNKNPKYSKYHTVRYDRIPTALQDEIFLHKPSDYTGLIPDTVPDKFTVKQFAKICKITEGTAGLTLNIMNSIKAIKRTGNNGRAYVYSRI